jgi:hypothetical protein
VDVIHDEVTYTLRDGPKDQQLTILHAGEELELSTTEPTTVTIIKREPLLPTPQQPPGRAPMHRNAYRSVNQLS